MLTFKNEDAHAIVETNLGAEAKKEQGNLDFWPFPEYKSGPVYVWSPNC